MAGQKVGIGTSAPVTKLNIIGGGTHPTAKMKLRIIYSKI